MASVGGGDGKGNQAEKSTEVDSEASAIRKYERRVEWPTDLAEEQSRWEDMREYVHTDAMLLDEEDAVGTNYILRYQQATMAVLRTKDPAPRIQPREFMPPREQHRLPVDYPTEMVLYAQTHRIVIDFQSRQGGLKQIINGAIQDSMTLPIAWVKMRVQEDFMRDPLGADRNNDQQDSIKRYERLRLDFDNGVFTDRSPEFYELKKLDEVVRGVIVEEKTEELGRVRTLAEDERGDALLDDNDDPIYLGGEDIQAQIDLLTNNPEELIDADLLPEIAHYRGFTWQQVDPEDVRWDWNVRRPEDLRYAKWMAHRAWMTEQEIRDKWTGVSQDDLRTAARFSQDGYKVTLKDSADSDPEYGGKDDEERNRGDSGTGDDIRRGEKLAVWEYWDRVQGRVFRWVQGTGVFLDDFVPEFNARRFFPLYPIVFNRVTGKLFGPSDTDLQQPLQDELNRLRTWQSEAQKSAHPRWMVAKGLLRPSERQKFEEALPYSVTEVERAEDVAKSVFPIVPPDYNQSLYDRSSPMLELQQMSGAPAAALGAGGGTGLATDSAIANEQMGNQTDFRVDALLDTLAEMYQSMAEINAQMYDEPEIIEICGPGAVWPELSRQQILSNFIIEAEATGNDAATRKQELDAWNTFFQVTGPNGAGIPWDPIVVAKKMLRLMDQRENPAEFIDMQAMQVRVMQVAEMLMGGGAGAPPPQNQPAPGGGPPQLQGDFGAGGGAPPGQPMSDVPAPDQVPGPA